MGFFQKTKEKNIFRKIEKGDEGAFVWFYDQYAPKIYRFVYLKTNSSPDAEDLTSEAFLRLWKEISNSNNQNPGGDFNELKRVENPRALLYQIVRNLVVDYYRKKPKAELIVNEEEEGVLKNIPSQEPDLEEKMALKSDISQVREALKQINDDYQDLILWHYLDDFSVKEIAQILEKPEDTVRVQLHRALMTLQKILK